MNNDPNQKIPLIGAILTGDITEVRHILSTGADVDANNSGYTVLYRAISAHHEDACKVVRVLLEAGADPNKKQGTPYSETTPLGLAVGDNLTSIVELLLKGGANVDSAYALHIAAKRGNPEILRMLIEHGGNVRLAEPDHALEELPIDVFEFSLAYRRSRSERFLDEETIQQVREMLAVQPI